MLFEFIYNEQKFLITLEHFDRLRHGIELFEIKSSDDPNDTDEYEIKMFLDEDGQLTPVKVTELPKDFLDVMAKELKGAMPISFFANPHFDEVMVFFGKTVPTAKDRFIPVSCIQCKRNNLYEKKGKGNKKHYIEDIQTKLRNKPNPAWPFKGRLQVQFSVSDKQKRLNTIDLDNLSKAILDSLKGIVFEDDAQIDVLVATKDFTEGMIAHIIAIKELQLGERPKIQEFLFSGRYKTWRDEYRKKEAAGKPTRFTKY